MWYVEPFPKFDAGAWFIDTSSLIVLSHATINSHSLVALVLDALLFIRDSLNEQLCHEAVKLRDANQPPQGDWFTESDVVRLLRFGELKYLGTQLQVNAIETSDDFWADSSKNGNDIRLNITRIVEYMSAYPAYYSENELGYKRIMWRLAATILHEMMHNHGFDHVKRDGDYDPTSPYYRSLPLVAAAALLKLNNQPFAPGGRIPFMEQSNNECARGH